MMYGLKMVGPLQRQSQESMVYISERWIDILFSIMRLKVVTLIQPSHCNHLHPRKFLYLNSTSILPSMQAQRHQITVAPIHHKLIEHDQNLYLQEAHRQLILQQFRVEEATHT